MLTILVPQGSEYASVCRGLQRLSGKQPQVLSIPLGIQPLTAYLQQWSKTEDFENQIPAAVLVMGLCGSLNQHYKVGDVVLYENCMYQEQLQVCSDQLNADIQNALRRPDIPFYVVKSWTSDRLICSASEKRYLGETIGADVVDMEGFAVLEFFHQLGVAVTMLRVVSDDCHHDIPDLTTAINPDGSLQPLSLALQFIRQPIAATRLIQGSLQALKVLEKVTQSLFTDTKLG